MDGGGIDAKNRHAHSSYSSARENRNCTVVFQFPIYSIGGRRNRSQSYGLINFLFIPPLSIGPAFWNKKSAGPDARPPYFRDNGPFSCWLFNLFKS